MKEREVIYEPHPVSPERKAELRAEGYKIIDARFAPVTPIRKDGPTVAEYVAAGYLASGYPPKGYASRSTEDEIADAIAAHAAATKKPKEPTIAEIKEALVAKGIEIPEGVTKRDDLKALLDADGEQGTDKGE